MARQTRYILTIEYEYAQLCILSVVLQAVINRNCRDSTSGRLESCSEGTSTEEEKHLRGTVSAARAILRTALDDLLPHGSLRYIPVRSYSRLLGATLILLKVSDYSLSFYLVRFFSLAFISLTSKISAAQPGLARLTSPCHLIWSGEWLLAFATLQSMIRT